MIAFNKLIGLILAVLSLASEKTRAVLLRIRGACVGSKTRIGIRVKITRPWAVSIGKRVEVEEDVFIKMVTESARFMAGDYVFIGKGVEIDVAEKVVIGAHSLLAPGVFIADHEHNIVRDKQIDEQGCISKPVVIGEDVWIGTHAVILAGITIGNGAVVGAGAVVTKDVPEYAVVAGVPARILHYRT